MRWDKSLTFQLHHCRKISDDLLKSKTFFFIFSSRNCFYCINLALFFCKNKVKTASCEHFIMRPNDSVYICFLYKFQSSVGYNPSHVTHPTHVLFPQSEMMFKKNQSWCSKGRTTPGFLQRTPGHSVWTGARGLLCISCRTGERCGLGSFGEPEGKGAHHLALKWFHILMVGSTCVRHLERSKITTSTL